MKSDPFRNRDHIANFDALVEEFKAKSLKTRARLRMLHDVSYGEGQSEKLDLFFPEHGREQCPVHVFIHGGYWRMFSKDDFSYIADNVTACGAIAAIIDYSFMPAVRFGEIIGQIGKALAWLDANINGLGGDRTRLSISGHSAGAHLASFSFIEGATTPQIKGALLLSGIYDLKPLQSSFLEPLIGIRDDEVEQYSPLHLSHRPSGRVIVAVGEQETAPFREQTSSLVAHLEAQGLQVDEHAIPATNHMTVVLELGNALSTIGKLLGTLIRQS